MPASVPIDPRQNMRAQLAFTIRLMREMKGLSQNELAKELFVTRETIAAYESRRNHPDEKFCRKLDEFFGTCELFQGLWHHGRREHLHEWFEAYVSHESEATEIRTFQPLNIPGLLQTEGYMRAGAVWSKDAETVISERLARRDILTREGEPPHLFAVVDESAIMRPVGGASTTREQLQHLLSLGELPQVHIQVVRHRSGWYNGLDGAVVVVTKNDRTRVGYVEAQFGGRLIEDPAEVTGLGIRFDEIRGRALSEDGSRDLIRKTMETMRDDPVAEE